VRSEGPGGPSGADPGDLELLDQVRAFFDASSEGVYGLDADGRFTFINRAGARLLGYEPQEVIGKDLHDLLHASSGHARDDCALLRALHDGSSLHTDSEILWRKDGTSFAADFAAHPILRQGHLAGAVGMIADVSVKKRAEEALRKTHGILQAIVEGTTDVVTVTDLDGRYLLINGAGARYFGTEPESVLGRQADAFFDAESAKALREAESAVIAANETRTFEETLSRRDGTWTFLSTKGPYRDGRGQPIGVIGISRDISDRKQMEATLRLQAAALQLLQTTAIAANQAPSVEEAIGVAMGRIASYAGWPIGCALLRDRSRAPVRVVTTQFGEEAPKDLAPEDVGKLATQLELSSRVFASGKPEWVPDLQGLSDPGRAVSAMQLGLHGAFALPVAVGGEVLAALLFLSPQAIEPDPPLIVVLANAGAQLGLVVQRKRGEETLRASEERNRLILETATDAFVGVDAQGQIVEWNRQATETFGWSREEAVGKPILATIFPPGTLPLEQLITDESAVGTRVELTALRADGRQFPAEMTIWAAPKGRGFSAFVHDITDRKRAEEALRNANEKLTSWVSELERRNREVSLLNEMGDLLQSCLTAEEAHGVIAQFVQQLFPSESGALFVLSASRNLLESVCMWGDSPPAERVLAPEDCWALRRGRVHALGPRLSSGPRCRHLLNSPALPTLCVPMMAQGEALGMLLLQEHNKTQSFDAEREAEGRRRLATTVGEHIALSLANFKLRETLRNQSIRDALTGLYNRRYMEETLDRELRRAERKERTLGLIVVDVDHFKHYNDALGHEAGDTLLRGLSDFFQTQVRREDVVCRFGGEEFTLILPEASLEIAKTRAEQLRDRVRQIRVEHRGLPLETVTLSLGVAVYPQHGANAEELFRAADAALYRAKAGGRDRVEIAGTAVPAATGEAARTAT